MGFMQVVGRGVVRASVGSVIQGEWLRGHCNFVKWPSGRYKVFWCTVPREPLFQQGLPIPRFDCPSWLLVGSTPKFHPERAPQLEAKAGPDDLGIDVRLEGLRSILYGAWLGDTMAYLNQVSAENPATQAANCEDRKRLGICSSKELKLRTNREADNRSVKHWTD